MSRRPSRSTFGFTLIDLLVAVAVVVLLLGAALPAAVSRRRQAAMQTRCASNLRQIGQAIQMYANENKGNFPRTRYDPARSDKPLAYTAPDADNPFAADGPGPNDVTAPLFLLARTQDLTSDVFICRAARGRRWSGDDLQKASNFQHRRQLGYSYINPYPGDAAVKAGFKLNYTLTSDFAVAADMNPGGDALTKVTAKTPYEQLREANSPNHDRDGQNVLYADGHVEFQNTAFCGMLRKGGGERDSARDHIYTFGPSGNETGGAGVIGAPADALDSVLLPTMDQGKPPSEPATRPAPKPARGDLAWTLDEANARLALNPRDPYLQFVVLQLARQEDRVDEYADEIEDRAGIGGDGRRDPDLFGLFTGDLAVHESLQLDTMRNDPAETRRRIARRPALASTRPATQPASPSGPAALSALVGPAVKSHPWEQMLAKQTAAGKKPRVSPLAKLVPEDFYLVEFQSLGKLLEAADTTDVWGTHLFIQGAQQSRDERFSQRLRQQIALKTESLLQPFYDQVIERVAVTGSDLFWREGSDVTFLFRLKQPAAFKARADAFLAEAQKARPDAKRQEGQSHGVAWVQLATPDRQVSVFSAYPSPDLHVRGNSRAAFERVLQAVKGGGDVKRLGDSAEFQYVRTLLPGGAPEEDGLVYLSDPFIRRLVGPKVKITERRRLVCSNHLRMIGHAALLYRNQYGKQPASLAQLAEAQCAPGVFGEKELTCPDGGRYELVADGTAGACSVHNRVQFLTPCCEIPLEQATGEEAEDYRAFVEAYSRYWQRYFDPIVLRMQLTPQRYRVETLVLPLIDNSVYTALARSLGGEPEALDALPVPKRNIFSVAVKLNKQKLLEPMTKRKRPAGEELLENLGIGEESGIELNVEALLTRGLGNQVGLHVYDEQQQFDLNLPQLFGLAMAAGAAGGADDGDFLVGGEFSLLLPLIASLNSPVYVSVPVQDAKVVDDFLANADKALAILASQRGEVADFIEFEKDFYRLAPPAGRADAESIRCGALRVGPITWRFFWARIGDGLYVASKQFILEDLIAAQAGARPKDAAQAGARPKDAPPPPASALARVRPENWDRVLPGFRLAWAENNRRACLDNLGPLSGVRRAYAPVPPGGSDDPAKAGADAHAHADRLYGVHFFCPDGGRYVATPDGKDITCSLHGSGLAPRQTSAPNPDTQLGQLLNRFGGMAATLTFLEDGLHAVVTIDRK